MKISFFTILLGLLIFMGLTGFKPPKTNTYPKGDILYSKYGGNVDSMMAGERKLDSMAHPFLYKTEEVKEEEAPSIDDESVILEKAEIMPQFPDGEKGLKDYLSSGTAFIPDTLIGKKATVIVKFYVSTLGDAKNPKVIKSDDPSFDVQAIMLIDAMPKWTPGKQNGKEVNCYMTIPFKYGQ